MGTKREELNPLTQDAFAAICAEAQISIQAMNKISEALNRHGIVVCKPQGCIASAEWDEPMFTLLARDMIAPFLVRQWARHFAMLRSDVQNVGSETRPDVRVHIQESARKKHDEAITLASRMDAWHIKKIPD